VIVVFVLVVRHLLSRRGEIVFFDDGGGPLIVEGMMVGMVGGEFRRLVIQESRIVFELR
jgi:hypothetical protein